MLAVVHVDRIQECLRAVASVVDAQQRREMDFPKRVLDWLADAEKILHDARQAGMSQISSLRSTLLTTHHGSKRNLAQTRRAQMEAVASEVLAKGQEVLTAAIEPRVAQIAEAELLVSRVLAVASVKGSLRGVPKSLPHEALLAQILSALKQDQDTVSATVHFMGILGPVDSLIVLDRVLGNRLSSPDWSDL